MRQKGLYSPEEDTLKSIYAGIRTGIRRMFATLCRRRKGQ